MAKCNNNKCGTSSIGPDSFGFGAGRLNTNGFYEFPCDACARAFEEKHPEYKGRCWPPQGQDIEKLSEELTRECDEDDNP